MIMMAVFSKMHKILDLLRNTGIPDSNPDQSTIICPRFYVLSL